MSRIVNYKDFTPAQQEYVSQKAVYTPRIIFTEIIAWIVTLLNVAGLSILYNSPSTFTNLEVNGLKFLVAFIAIWYVIACSIRIAGAFLLWIASFGLETEKLSPHIAEYCKVLNLGWFASPDGPVCILFDLLFITGLIANGYVKTAVVVTFFRIVAYFFGFGMRSLVVNFVKENV